MPGDEDVQHYVEHVGIYIAEAEGCAEAGRFLAACVMPLEKESDPEKGWRKRPPETWHLMELVRLARRAGWLPAQIPGSDAAEGDEMTEAEVDDLLKFVNEVRNTAAHPGKHLRKGREIPDFDVDGSVFAVAYRIVRTAFSYTYATALVPAMQSLDEMPNDR